MSVSELPARFNLLFLPETPKRLTHPSESADNRSNERSLLIDLVRNRRPRPFASSIANRSGVVEMNQQDSVVIV
jgi:hypothetical protein